MGAFGGDKSSRSYSSYMSESRAAVDEGVLEEKSMSRPPRLLLSSLTAARASEPLKQGLSSAALRVRFARACRNRNHTCHSIEGGELRMRAKNIRIYVLTSY